MEDYNKNDVVNALLSLDIIKRTRVLVDQRSYLIGLLAYRFMMTEHQIGDLINLKRNKINYNKKLVIQFHNDKSYKQNVYVYAMLFPFDFSMIEIVSVTQRAKRVELDLDKKLFNKVKAAGAILGHNDVRVTIKLFIEKSLKLWEE
jgi:hypothetical protein